MAVKFIDGSKLYTIREFGVMRDGTMIIKIADREGKTIWVSADCLEVFEG